MKKLIVFAFAISIILSCTNKRKNKENDNGIPKVTDSETVYKVKIYDNELIVCNFNKIDKTVVDFPLSELISDCKMIKLETNKESFIKVGNTIITENFIGIRNFGGVPFKLFDHSGKFIRNIGKIGRGPNEYNAIYSEFIDEKNDRVYLLPWPKKQIYSYNLLGQANAPVELCFATAKAQMFLNGDTLTILNLPFDEKSAIAFTQTTSGKLLNVVYANSLALKPDYSNEIICSHNSSDFDFQLSKFFQVSNDTLYHYNLSKGELIPKFTMYFEEEEVPIHNYFELPNHFIIKTMQPYKGKRETRGIGVHKEQYIIVDKAKLTAQFINLKNDFFCGINADISFNNGKFINNIPAITLKEEIEKKLIEKDEMASEIKNKLIELNNNLEIEDNNVVFYGDLKPNE